MNHYRTVQTPAHHSEHLLNLVYTWLARALGFGLLLGMTGLWIYSILQRLN